MDAAQFESHVVQTRAETFLKVKPEQIAQWAA